MHGHTSLCEVMLSQWTNIFFYKVSMYKRVGLLDYDKIPNPDYFGHIDITII